MVYSSGFGVQIRGRYLPLDHGQVRSRVDQGVDHGHIRGSGHTKGYIMHDTWLHVVP